VPLFFVFIGGLFPTRPKPSELTLAPAGEGKVH
jgi:hypothetical protein